ncbi:MAG: transcription termination/antitermination protein NusA [Clostridia bacterium]|nr:transcription termination/antitermination protein NusA [Clostridiales bacterium]MBQ2976942.1 transcription termination/antitermination protein NusA [Clostridia bacterium]MBQ6804019.1 transcription termination/antitermination protein NusA [Clostridia bacterium]
MAARKSEMMDAIENLAKAKDISLDQIVSAVEEGCKAAYRRNVKGVPPVNLSVVLSREHDVQIFARKVVSEVVEDDSQQISLEEARALRPNYELGDIVEIDVTPADFGRVAAQTAKQVILQRLREAERGKIYDEYIEKENEILTAIVEKVEPKAVYVELGRTAGVLEASEFMPGEEYRPGDHIKVYVLQVYRSGRDATRAPQVAVSRIHTGLVKRLFEMEVPEIATGIVQIKSIAREAGSRTKMAVASMDAMIDPVGACVGPRGSRVDKVVSELKNEKIDIIKWSQDPAEFVANALNPAHVVSVFVSDKEKICRVVVPDNQLSLAIGKEGQNARLAAKLTGWKIDIKSQTQVAELLRQEMPELPEGNGQVIADEYEDYDSIIPDDEIE